MTGHTPDRRGARILRIGTSVGLSQVRHTGSGRGDTELPLGSGMPDPPAETAAAPPTARALPRPEPACRPSTGVGERTSAGREHLCVRLNHQRRRAPDAQAGLRGASAHSHPCGEATEHRGWHLAPGAGSRRLPGTDGGLHPFFDRLPCASGPPEAGSPPCATRSEAFLAGSTAGIPGECRQPIGPRVDDTGSTGPDKSFLALA